MRIVAVSEVQRQDQTVVLLIEQGLYVVTIADLAVSVLVSGIAGRPLNVYKNGSNNIKNFNNHMYTPKILTLPWLQPRVTMRRILRLIQKIFLTLLKRICHLSSLQIEMGLSLRGERRIEITTNYRKKNRFIIPLVTLVARQKDHSMLRQYLKLKPWRIKWTY